MRDRHGLVGATIGQGARRYRVLRAVAEGGFAVVYEGVEIGSGDRVAIKALHLGLDATSGARARFLQEATLLGALKHPVIVALREVIDVPSDDGSETTPCLILEWLDGQTLDRRIADDGPMGLAEAIALLSPIVDAIEHAHEASIVHRDLKPSNVMITSTGIKLLDFGIARWSNDLGVKTSTGDLAGASIGFAAPEQYSRDLGAIDGRTDQFALAALVHAALTAEAPFGGSTPAEVMYATCASTRRPSVRTEHPEVPTAVDKTLQRALAIAPKDRFPTVRAFWEALTRAATEPATSHRREAVAPSTVPDARERSPSGAPPSPATLPSPEGAHRISDSAAHVSPKIAPQLRPSSSPQKGVSAEPLRRSTTDATTAAARFQPRGSLSAPDSRRSAAPSSSPSRGRGLWGLLAALCLVAPAVGYVAWQGKLPWTEAPVAPPPRKNSKPRPSSSGVAPSVRATINAPPPVSTSSHPPLGPCGAIDTREACIEGGRFRRGPSDCAGGPRDEPHRAACPSRELSIASFALDRFEVSVERYAACARAHRCAPIEGAPVEGAPVEGPSAAPGDDRAGALPIAGVTFDEAVEFCRWDGDRRLPTDDEWERAAVGREGRTFPWGNSRPTPTLARHVDEIDPRDGATNGPDPIGTHEIGATPDGVQDLAGNVAEWTSTPAAIVAPHAPSTMVPDASSDASSDASPDAAPDGVKTTDPDAGDGGIVDGGSAAEPPRWVRGGSFDSRWDGLRGWVRMASPAATRAATIGFRCARSLAPASERERPPRRGGDAP